MPRYFADVLIQDTMDCTAASTGSLQTTGGAYVAKQLRAGGVLTAAANVASTTTATGSLVVIGGLGVSGAYFGTSMSLSSTATVSNLYAGNNITSSTTYIVGVNHNFVDPAGTTYGIYAKAKMALTADNAQTTYAIYGLANYAGAKNISGAIAGLYGQGLNQATAGLVSNILGIWALANNAGVNASNVYGISTTATMSGSGTTTNLFGLWSNLSKTSGTVVNAYGVYINPINQGSTLNYSIYTGAGVAYFGDTTAATALGTGALQVAGGASITGALWGSTANFSGAVVASTAAPGTSTTQVATTAFVGAAVIASNPMSALGDMIYGGTAGAKTRLAGTISSNRHVLGQQGTGSVSAAPGWVDTTGYGSIVCSNGPQFNIMDTSVMFSGDDGMSFQIRTTPTDATVAQLYYDYGAGGVSDLVVMEFTPNGSAPDFYSIVIPNGFLALAAAFTSTTAATSPTTGSLRTAGGLGVGGRIYAADTITTQGTLEVFQPDGDDYLRFIQGVAADATVECSTTLNFNCYAQFNHTVAVNDSTEATGLGGNAGGSLTILGGAAVSKKLFVGGAFNVATTFADPAATVYASVANATMTATSSNAHFVVGARGYATYAGNQAVTGGLAGGSFQGENAATTGTMTNCYGLDVSAKHSGAGTTTTLAGLVVTASKTAGTVTTAIGVSVNAVTAGATNYAIKTSSGIVSLGDTTVSTLYSNGALVVAGGVGVADKVIVGGNVLAGMVTGGNPSLLGADDSDYPILDLGGTGAGGRVTITANFDDYVTYVDADHMLILTAQSSYYVQLICGSSGITVESTRIDIGATGVCALNGTSVTAPTVALASDSSTNIATTAFVHAAMAAGGYAASLILPKTSGAGIQVDTAAPTFPWRDMPGELIPKTTGTGTPTWSVLTGSNSDYSFTTGDKVDVKIPVPHDYLPGSDLFLCLDWCHNGTAISGAFLNTVSVTYSKGSQQTVWSTPVVLTLYKTTPNVATIPQLQVQSTEVQLSTSGGYLASAVNVTITSGSPNLSSATDLWTAGDVGKTVRVTAAGAAGGNLDTTIITFTDTKHVVLNNNAGTTVTAQPNYKQRMLDTSSIEPDGVLNFHFVQTTIPTISGGTVASPFLHYAIVHYQSTGIGTKQKSPNFYV